MKEIDYTKVAQYNVKRMKETSSEVIYYEYATLICALYDMSWTHRDILGFLHSEVEEMRELVPSKRVTNKTLTRYRQGWVKAEMIDIDAVKQEVSKLREAFGEKPRKAPAKPKSGEAATIFGVSYTVLSFMKELEKRGVLIAQEQEWIKTFFNEFSKKYALEELVSQYLAQQSSFIAG